MATVPDVLVQHGVAMLFAWAFAVQAGVPAPAIPMLVGAGALSGAGRMNLALAVGAAMTATLCADALWYTLGRSLGILVLGRLSRFSRDPDAFVRDAKKRFLAHRVRYLVLAKFLPGANPVAAALAGVTSVPPDRFLLSAASGALLWAGAWIVLGYACADVIAFVATEAAHVGMPIVVVSVTLATAYVVLTYVRRWRVHRRAPAFFARVARKSRARAPVRREPAISELALPLLCPPRSRSRE